MPAAWEILCTWGVPWGAIRSPCSGALPADEVAGALRQLVATGFSTLDGGQRECLLAWLRGFRHHWPHRFASILGDPGRAALSVLDVAVTDPNRYLKLRRIAIENLAGSL